MSKQTLFTGIQPTGKLHLGNFFGAVNPFRVMHREYNSYMCIANLHSLTAPQTDLKNNTFELVKTLMACGIPSNNIFIQSDVSEHTELYYLLSCYTKLGELERMTQFKAKSENKERENLGLLSYPVLMAADILLYQTDIVPIGYDQKQHLELARLLANRFNKKFPDTFTVPKAKIDAESCKIMSLTNPLVKMSKSDPNQKGVIYLSDEEDVIRKKIKGAVTTDDGIRNLLVINNLIYKYMFAKPIYNDVDADVGTINCTSLKTELTDALVAATIGVQEYVKLLDIGVVAQQLEINAQYAKRKARQTLNRLKEKLEI